MVEKLLLLAITLYTPSSGKQWTRLCAATVLSSLSLAVAATAQPLGDILEVTLDATSRCGDVTTE
jgi:hypothetical protein